MGDAQDEMNTNKIMKTKKDIFFFISFSPFLDEEIEKVSKKQNPTSMKMGS